ncbi:hypothetical protein O181_101875 [Austropuccinia psidii MF-1]|uniref:Uncharacterized protein n=1 Tax=Austropuccinia psidii MF-1 TaxID=1389203 RepID=A0A9Q3PI82_9BASI|nr:hypothetical protein [Austropuccinia psidii MF-1]
MHEMTQIMANLQEASSSESSRPPAFKNPSMKAPECFDGTQPLNVRSFIQSCESIFHNDPANFSQDRKKVHYATSFLIGRDAKWIEHYLSNITNQDPSDLLNYCNLLEFQLFTLFGGTTEVRKDEAELDASIMMEGAHVSLLIANFRHFVSRIGDWGERALIHHFRKGFPSRILDQLASHPSRIDSLQHLMNITQELDNRYHERSNEKSHNQENNPEAKVIDTPKGEELILGFEFLNQFNPSIDWRQGLIQFNADLKVNNDPSNSFSNYFYSSKSCVALVGDSRTPSFPSSVHIPSLNSHTSLLSSRDEVFKVIQDCGEDNSVSSLNLFLGNMDLPPSSYHDSVEQLWDEKKEPEEVENMMKAVSSAYNQYVDVFPKVKAEKPPPHCACDHHIELEGSPPPVGMIYSLSNQESDTLRAYILENVEKDFIWPSSSSTGASVLFFKKKDGDLHLFFDYCKLNSVTRNNKYPVPPINQLPTVFNGSSIFYKIYLHVSQPRILTLLLDGGANPTWSQVGPIGHVISIMAN